MSLEPGQRVDRYVVEALVGQGGLAEVYRVRHVELGTEWALKLLTWKKESLADRLLTEGKIQAQLRHPNVVTVTDVVRHEGQLGLLMEYVDHETLETYLARLGALPLDQALTLFAAVLSAVDAAHHMGVLHRDLKPANIMLAPSPSGPIPKVTDFGIAKVVGEGVGNGLTREGSAMGTPGYLAPEQVLDASSVDERTDIFALAAILYEVISGCKAFADENGQLTLGSTLNTTPPPLPENIPAHIRAALVAALDHDREQRPSSVRAFAEALLADAPDLLSQFRDPAQAHPLSLDIRIPDAPEPTLAPPSGTTTQGGGVTLAPVDLGEPPDGDPPARRRSSLWIGGGLLCLGAIIGVFWEASPQEAPTRTAIPQPKEVEVVQTPDAVIENGAKPPSANIAEPVPPTPAEPTDPPVVEAKTQEPPATVEPEPAVAPQPIPEPDPASMDEVPASEEPIDEPGDGIASLEEAPEAAPPEDPPPSPQAPSIEGTWNGRAKLPMRLEFEQAGTQLAGRVTFLYPTGERSTPLEGTIDPDGRLSFTNDSLVFQGVVQGGTLQGTYRQGNKKAQDWEASR